jgi:hypothetical protein
MNLLKFNCLDLSVFKNFNSLETYTSGKLIFCKGYVISMLYPVRFDEHFLYIFFEIWRN